MKKILAAASALVLLTGCYEDYVRDYDYSAVFAAYQYDLRTFVLGEDASFEFQVALGGVMQNRQDRRVDLVLEEGLLDGAVAGLTDKNRVSGEYVATAVKEAGITQVSALPARYYTLEGMDGLTIRRGAHTAAVTVKAADAIAADPLSFKPYYALGFRITGADADTVLVEKNYAVIAVKCENSFYGFWTLSGVRQSYDWTGNLVATDREEASLADARTYELTTTAADRLTCNKVAGSTGTMTLTFDGDAITISSPDGTVTGTGSFSGDVLLQNRKLFLEYRIAGTDGAYDEVRDTLSFRNRIRDGVNEWQDENPEHYR